MGSNISVLNIDSILNTHSLKEFGGVAAGGDCRSTAEGLEYSLLNNLSIFGDLDLEFHDISTSWCSNETGAHGSVTFGEGTHVSWIFVMVNHLSVIGEGSDRGLGEGEGWLSNHSCVSEGSHSHGSEHTL